MRYENHIPPEGINSSQEHPLKELAILVGGIALVVIIAIFLLNLLVAAIADKVPYEYEEKIASVFVSNFEFGAPTADELKIQAYLQALTDELAANMDMPAQIKLTVHYSDADMVNAFATLGGHIFMYRGLIEKLPNENALSMVLAHEAAHIKHRHPISSMGQGISLALVLAVVAGASDEKVASTIGQLVNINSMHFSRANEHQSDVTGLDAVNKKYGHIQGADELFKVFLSIQEDSPTEFFSTHPLSQNRIEDIQRQAEKNNWLSTGATTPLPNFIVQL